MTGDRRRTRIAWQGPVAAWLALMILFGINFAVSYVPLGAGNPALNLAIIAAMLALLVAFLMDLRNAKVVVRLIAGGSLLWLVLMFTLTFTDYLARHY